MGDSRNERDESTLESAAIHRAQCVVVGVKVWNK